MPRRFFVFTAGGGYGGSSLFMFMLLLATWALSAGVGVVDCFTVSTTAFIGSTSAATAAGASRFFSNRRRRCHRIRTSNGAGARTPLAAAATKSYMDVLSEAASEALGRSVSFKPTSGGGGSGGGGATTSAVVDENTSKKYFVKSAGIGKFDMLHAEYVGCREMANTGTLRVPIPVAFGRYQQASRSFVIFEYLEFCGSGGGAYQRTLGKQLAQMHRCTSSNDGMFGFRVNNSIVATFQPSLPWKDDWRDFWDEHRLYHMLKLTNNARSSAAEIAELREKTRKLLSHNPAPSLLHGDLWGGNKGFVRDPESDRVVPCVFDPATYYGDREADIAMTYLFGGFTSDFYAG